MYRVFVRFYGELNDFLPCSMRVRPLSLEIKPGHTVLDVIHTAGIPYNAVDLVLINGSPAEFSIKLKPHDRVTLYPEFHSIDISPFNLINRHQLH